MLQLPLAPPKFFDAGPLKAPEASMMRLPFSTTNDESAMDSASIVTGPALPGVGVPALAGTGVGVLAETCVRTPLSTRAAAPALRRPTSLIVSPEFSATLAIVKLVPTVPSG